MSQFDQSTAHKRSHYHSSFVFSVNLYRLAFVVSKRDYIYFRILSVLAVDDSAQCHVDDLLDDHAGH